MSGALEITQWGHGHSLPGPGLRVITRPSLPQQPPELGPGTEAVFPLEDSLDNPQTGLSVACIIYLPGKI